jgi:hypothetical protein
MSLLKNIAGKIGKKSSKILSTILPKRHVFYTILGHSDVDQLRIRQIPYNIILLLPTRCGADFARDPQFEPIFKNVNKIKNYTNSMFVFNGRKQNLYSNQNISIGPSSQIDLLKHGVYRLPTNLFKLNNASNIYTSEIQSKRNERVRLGDDIFNFKSSVTHPLSKILQDISTKIGPTKIGFVIGLFCRGIKGSRLNVVNTGAYNKITKQPREKVTTSLRNFFGRGYGRNLTNQQQVVLRKLRPSSRAPKLLKNNKNLIYKRQLHLVPTATSKVKTRRSFKYLLGKRFKRLNI